MPNLYQTKYRDGRDSYEHVCVAEDALGKRLPQGAIVHHVDYNPRNNAPSNLVVCPSQAYHKLIHTRTDGLRILGSVDARRCRVCGEWGLGLVPRTWKGQPQGHHHRLCINAYVRERQRIRKEKKAAQACPSS